MNFADIVAACFWPIGAAVGLIYLRFRSSENFKIAFPIVASQLLIWPFIFLFVLLGARSRLFYFDFQLGAVVLGVVVLLASYRAFASRPAMRAPFKSIISVFATTAAGLISLGWGVLQIYGDYIAPRLMIEGPIQDLWMEQKFKGPPNFVVHINGATFYAIESDFNSLRIRELIRAEAGHGSRYIFRLERLGN